MDWRTRLAQKRQAFPKGPDDLPPKPPKPGSVSFVSAPADHSENVAGADYDGMRVRLMHLAADDENAATLVRQLPAEHVAACVGLPDTVLVAYLRALKRSERMDAGEVPAEYTAVVYCAGCGPVWLWPGATLHVLACPWCFRRKAGKPFPRPPMVPEETR